MSPMPDRRLATFFYSSEGQTSAALPASAQAAPAPPSPAHPAVGSAAVAPTATAPPASVQVTGDLHPAGVHRAAETPLNSGLIARVLGEYREMPGLRLTLGQACRLWSGDAATVLVVLELLVARGSLRRSGLTYMLADSGRQLGC